MPALFETACISRPHYYNYRYVNLPRSEKAPLDIDVILLYSNNLQEQQRDYGHARVHQQQIHREVRLLSPENVLLAIDVIELLDRRPHAQLVEQRWIDTCLNAIQ